MEDIEIGKKVTLRPIANFVALKREGRPFIQRQRPIKPNDKKMKAQELYYSLQGVNNNGMKPPVHQRLGGPVRQGRLHKGHWYNLMNPDQFVKPRIRKGPDGLVTPRYYNQRAQKRIYNMQKKWRQRHGNGLQMLQVQVPNSRTSRYNSRYPSFVHSLTNSLTVEIQEQLALFKEQTVEHQVLDDDVPMPSEDQTNMSMDQRFSRYP